MRAPRVTSGAHTWMLGALVSAIVMLATAGVAHADDPQAEMQVDGRPHVGIPFTLSLATDGFDESPKPETSNLEIPGATVSFIGGTPNVSHGVQIVNGRRSDFTSVRWSFQWKVVVAKEGKIRVPAVTVTQAGKRAQSRGGEINVEAVPTTDDMKIQLGLPDRAVFVGETVPMTLSWLFKNQPQGSPTFTVPLFDTDAFTVDLPQANARRTLPFTIGGKDVKLPYDIDEVEVGGVKLNRVRVTVYAAPRKTGKIAVPPATVAVALSVGRQDFFGNAPSRLFRATDVAHTLEVKTLPETDRPNNFAGAVGTEFTIAVATSRSVVQLGEPVTLDITIKSKQRLDTLALPRLDGDGALPKEKFSIPADPPTGELSDDGTTKTFKVTAQITSPTNEIPAIAFSYFDPEKERYVTTHSDPIAMSVKGGTVVSAGDVVGTAPRKNGAPAADTTTDVSVGNVELALSSPGADDGPLSGSVLWVVVIALYAVPLALLTYRSWQIRTATRREEASEVKAARKRVEAELARATSLPARDAAGPLADALRALARTLEREPDDAGLLAELETQAFAPDPSGKPLSADLRNRADALARRWLAAAHTRPNRSPGAAVATILVVVAVSAVSAIVALPAIAHADSVSAGRAAYQDAMSTTNPTQRKAAFARAAASLGEVARAQPDHAELLTDWGNAALGAGDVATATIAYRRALLIDPSANRAQKNLGWLRSRASETFRPEVAGATDTLLFFHHWSRAQRLVTGGLAFAIAILMLVPWSGRRRRGLAGLSVVPFAIWLAMVVSIVFEDRRGDDAVVMEGVVMRAADSAGAPASLAQALPPGTEVTVLERRGSWTRVRVATGTTGWVPDGTVEMVRKR